MLLNVPTCPIIWWSTTAETVKFWCESSFLKSDWSREASVHRVYNYGENIKVMSSREDNVNSRALNKPQSWACYNLPSGCFEKEADFLNVCVTNCFCIIEVI